MFYKHLKQKCLLNCSFQNGAFFFIHYSPLVVLRYSVVGNLQLWWNALPRVTEHWDRGIPQEIQQTRKTQGGPWLHVSFNSVFFEIPCLIFVILLNILLFTPNTSNWDQNVLNIERYHCATPNRQKSKCFKGKYPCFRLDAGMILDFFWP